MEEQEKPELLFKIAVMGERGVGKTQLINCALSTGTNPFSLHYKCTVDVDFSLKIIHTPTATVRFQGWDIPGDTRHNTRNMSAYLRETDAVILVWDATRPETFDLLEKYFPFIEQGLPIIFVRSKADNDNKDQQDDFEARKKTIGEWATNWGIAPGEIAIVDTSSKDSVGKDELLNVMLSFESQLDKKQKARVARKNAPLPKLKLVERIAVPESVVPVLSAQAASQPVPLPPKPSEPFFLTERIEKMKHSRKPRKIELEACFEKKAQDLELADIRWLLMHLDSVEENCQTARDIKAYCQAKHINIDIVRPKKGPVPELLKLLDEEERAKFPKFVTLFFFASFSDKYVAERDEERKVILDVAKNIHFDRNPYEGLERNKIPKAVVDIIAKPAKEFK